MFNSSTLPVLPVEYKMSVVMLFTATGEVAMVSGIIESIESLHYISEMSIIQFFLTKKFQFHIAVLNFCYDLLNKYIHSTKLFCVFLLGFKCFSLYLNQPMTT